MAEVFRAVMPGAEGFRQTFVVKRILAERSRTADFVEMFVQEARMGAMLNHPNIVQVFDFGNVGGDYFLAMEYLRGRDVRAVMRKLREQKRQCPVPVAAFIAHQVALCLEYAHALKGPDGKRLNIVHRDVSPSNIMCLRTGGVKLLDFGIAKAFGETSLDNERVFKGKLAYVSPERIRNEPLDGRVDLFSLGVVLWEILAGRRLFRGKTDLETRTNVLDMDVPPPSSFRPDVPASLDFVVMRALERDRAARYPDGQTMADELDDVLQETRYHAKMLPALLRDIFGSDLASQDSLSVLSPELLALCTEGSVSASSTSLPDAGGRGWGWKRVAGFTSAAVATAALGAVLLTRGISRRSEAHDLPSSGAAQVTAAASVSPVPVPPPPAPATNPPGDVARGTGGDADERAAQPASHRRRSSRRPAKSDGDRVVRGLSIDPFADAARGGKP
jgi:eukaryotic-like serine/threonine-protein kinase